MTAFFWKYLRGLGNFLRASGRCCFLGLYLFFHRLHVDVCQNAARMLIDNNFLLLADLCDLLRGDDDIASFCCAAYDTHNRQTIGKIDWKD